MPHRHRTPVVATMRARIAAAAFVGLLAACSSPPLQRPSSVEPPFNGKVLGHSDRFVIYEPAPEDTLASLAIRFLGDAERRWMIADFNDIDHVEANRPIVIPLAPVNATGVQATEYQTVPILCYHRFGTTRGRMVVAPAQFAAQLDWLERNDYRVIPLRQLTGFLAGKDSLPRRAVVITVDDGHESAYQFAVPLLRKHGFPATFFVYTDYVGSGGAMSWTQLRELAASDLFEIGAHSKTHRNLAVRKLGETDSAYRSNLEAEVLVPIDLLAKQLKVPVVTYAYPYGDATETVLDLVAKDRIQLAASVTPGGNPFFAQPLLLRRTMIFGDFDLEAFKARLQIGRPLTEP